MKHWVKIVSSLVNHPFPELREASRKTALEPGWVRVGGAAGFHTPVGPGLLHGARMLKGVSVPKLTTEDRQQSP